MQIRRPHSACRNDGVVVVVFVDVADMCYILSSGCEQHKKTLRQTTHLHDILYIAYSHIGEKQFVIG